MPECLKCGKMKTRLNQRGYCQGCMRRINSDVAEFRKKRRISFVVNGLNDPPFVEALCALCQESGITPSKWVREAAGVYMMERNTDVLKKWQEFFNEENKEDER